MNNRIKIIFETSDNKPFDDKEKAEKHQNLIDTEEMNVIYNEIENINQDMLNENLLDITNYIFNKYHI